MKICILCEGSYPYVLGGVSSWVQQLINNFPEHEFIIYSIGADVSQKGKYAYQLPPNVKDITEVFLNDVYIEKETFDEQEISKWELEELRKLMLGNPDKWEYIFNFFTREKRIVSKFLMSSYFYHIAEEIYSKGFEKTIFVDFLWSMRSMYLTLFHVLNNPPPKADLYHSVSTGYAGIAAAMATYLYGSSYILTEHGIYTREREEDIIKAQWVQGFFKNLWIDFFKAVCFGAYKYADRIIALFETNSKIQQELGAPPEKTMVIANGINVASFEGLQQKPADEKGVNIGAVIRFSPIKDIKTMLAAFDIVKKKIPDAKFYIMGPTDEAPEYYEECMSLLREFGTADVNITGTVNVRDYLGKMDLVVLTSISEGQPLALMEAMAAGKPCVSTNVGCCKELFDGREGDTIGVSGLLAPVMNSEAIAKQIITLAEDPMLREQMGLNAKKRIETYYNEKLFVDSYRELYKEFEIAAELNAAKGKTADFNTSGAELPKPNGAVTQGFKKDLSARATGFSAAGTERQPQEKVQKSNSEVLTMRKKSMMQNLGELQNLNQILENSLDNHKKEIAKIIAENNVLNEKNRQAQADLDEKDQQIRNLNDQLDDLSEKNSKLEEELAALKSQAGGSDDFAAEKDKLIEELNQLRTENEAHRDEIERAASENDKKALQINEQSGELAQLKEQLAALSQQAEAGKDVKAAQEFELLENLTEENIKLKEEVRMLREEKANSQMSAPADIEALKTSMDYAKEEKEKLSAQLFQLAGQLTDSTARISELERRNLELERNASANASPAVPESSPAAIGSIFIEAHNAAQIIIDEAKRKAEDIVEDGRVRSRRYKDEISKSLRELEQKLYSDEEPLE